MTLRAVGRWAIPVLVIVTVVVIAWSRLADSSGSPSSSSSGDRPLTVPAEMQVKLDGLSQQIVPSSNGAFTFGVPEEEANVGTWALAVAVLDYMNEESVALRPSTTEAVAAIDAPALDRSTALDLTIALRTNPGSFDDPAVVGKHLLDIARSRFEAGQGEWLGPILNLSYGEDEVASEAASVLASVVAPGGQGPRCDALNPADADLPGPQAALNLTLRYLASSGASCPEAGELLERLIEEPAWQAPYAAFEVADLVSIGGTRARDAGRVWLDRSTRVWDTGRVPPLLQESVPTLLVAQAADSTSRFPSSLETLATAQASYQGRLPDSGGDSSVEDLAILRLLASTGTIGTEELEATQAAVRADAVSAGDVMHSVAMMLLTDNRVPSCDDAGAAIDGELTESSIEPTLLLSMAALRWRVSLCSDERVVVAAVADEIGDHAPSFQWWAAVYSGCALGVEMDEELDTATETDELDMFGDEDPWIQYIELFLANPSIGCASAAATFQ